MKEHFYIYILSSLHNRVLYIGVTTDLIKRVWEHKNKTIKGFTEKYNIDQLVYFEIYDNAEHALRRERTMKEWKRDWKIKLIETKNPEWDDLYEDICA
jgi:putative endonuclease